MALASGSERFRVPKTSSEETGLVNDTVPPSTKYKNKWAVNIFAEWQSLREVKVPVLDCGGVFNLIQTGGGGGAFRTPLRQNRDNFYTKRAVTFKFSDFS